MEIALTKYHDSEISKVTDFNHTANSPASVLNAVFDQLYADVENDIVITGLDVSPTTPLSMNVSIADGIGYSKTALTMLHLGFGGSVQIADSDPAQNRIDTLEMRLVEIDIDIEARAFQDPLTGARTYVDVPTKTKIGVEFQVVTGTPGAGVAPAKDAGWMKLAEIVVPYGAASISAANIKGITSAFDGEENAAWTTEKAASFRVESMEELKRILTVHTRATTGIHGAVSAATANALMIRDSAGRTKAAAPGASDDVAIKQTVDDHAALNAAGTHGSTVAATANRLVHRDTSGRSQFADPSAAADAATKGYVDTADATKAPIAHAAAGTTYGVGSASNYGHVKASAATPLMNGAAAVGTDNGLFAREGHVHPTDTSRAAASALTNHENANAAGTHGSTVAATANRLVHRDASGRSQFANPSAAADAATKGYVDTKDNYQAGTELLAGMEVNVPETGATSDTQLTEGFTCKRAGVLRIGFALARYSSGTFYARIYKNGVAVGTERSTTSATWVAQPTEDITVAAGDVITIRGRMSSSSHRGYLGNPYILISDAQHPDKIEMSLCRIINNMPTQVPPMINKQALIVSISTAFPGSGSTISISAPAGGTYSFVVSPGSSGSSSGSGFVSGGSTIVSGLYEANIITSLLLRRQS